MTIQPGNSTALVNVSTVQDELDEEDETFTLTLSNPTNATLSVATATGTIVDDEGMPVLSLSADATAVSEDVGTVVLTASISGSQYAEDQELELEFSGSAREGPDYTVSSKRLTLSANTSNASASATVTVVDDAADEDPETETIVAVLRLDGASAGSVTVTVTDDDVPAVTVRFASSSYAAAEGGASASVAVRLSEDPEREVVIPLTKDNQGGASAGDYSGVPSNLTFDAGETAQTFTVSAVDDTEEDGGESVVLGFGTLPSGVTAGTPATASVALQDDESGVQVTPVTLELQEGESGRYTVSLDEAPSGNVTVSVSVTDSASVTAAPSRLVFTASDYGARTVTVTARQDADARDEAATVTHAVTPAGLLTAAPVSVTVKDDESPATKVTLSVSPAALPEGGGTRAVTVTGRLDGAPERADVEVRLTAADGTADSDDYAAPGTVLTIAAGRIEARASFTVTIEGDGVDEADETLVVTGRLSSSQTLTVEPSGGLTVTITDDDERGVRVSPAALTVREG